MRRHSWDEWTSENEAEPGERCNWLMEREMWVIAVRIVEIPIQTSFFFEKRRGIICINSVMIS